MNNRASDGERIIGRVYEHHLTGWLWAMNAFGPGLAQRRDDRQADTKGEAAALVERCYDACRLPQGPSPRLDCRRIRVRYSRLFLVALGLL
jgi:hypothetical protein